MAAKHIFHPSDALASPNRQARGWPVEGAAACGLDTALSVFAPISETGQRPTDLEGL